MLLRLWLETPNGTQIPILLARRDERDAARLFPDHVLAALVHDTAAPPWKDTLFNRPRSGMAVDPAALHDAGQFATDELPAILRSRFGQLGPNIARSVCQWPDWHYPAHLVKLNSWWLPAGTARYPQGLFLIPASALTESQLPDAGLVTFYAAVTKDQGLIPEWSLVIRCYVTRLVKQGRLAVVALAGASRDLQSRWVQGPFRDWQETSAKLAAAGVPLTITPRWNVPLSEDATRGLWPAALAIESLAINHGILPVSLDGKTITGAPWDTVAYQILWGRASNIFEDVARPSRIGGLRVAFPVGFKGVPSVADEWFTVEVHADTPRGPFLPAVEAMWADGNPPRNRTDLERLAGWLITLVQMIPHGWAGQLIPGRPESEVPIFDWLLVRFSATSIEAVQRPFSAYNLPVEWLHAGLPAEITTTSSTSSTTPPPCSGTCAWHWTPGDNTWVLMSNECSEGCYCVGPQQCPPEGSDETVTQCGPEAIDPCTTTTTSTTTTQEPPSCAGSCTYRFNAKTGRWEIIDSGCAPVECVCDPSGLTCDYPDGAIVTRKCVRNTDAAWPICTTTTPPPCEGECRWVWDKLNKRWVLDTKGCSDRPGCNCSPPSFCGESWSDCAYTPCSLAPVLPEPDCGQPRPSTTSSTTSTSTSTTYAPCTGSCTWRWFLGAWRLQDNPCLSPCTCPRPQTDGQSECDVVTTPCQPPPRPTTTRPPESCLGSCQFIWNDPSMPLGYPRFGWNRINDVQYHCTASPGLGKTCACLEPSEPGQPCEVRFTPCRIIEDLPPPTTPQTPHCGAYCLWQYNSSEMTWILRANYCPAECPCSPPAQPPAHDAACELVKSACGTTTTSSSTTSSTTTSSTSSTTTSSTTTTTPAPCSGKCSWICMGSVWSLLDSTCTETCQGCSPPEGGCGDGETAQTACIQATTTTPDPNRCYGTCQLGCICADQDCTRGVIGVISSSCTGQDCVCVSSEIGKPCNPRLRILLSGICDKAVTTTTAAPTSSSTSTSTTITSTTTSTSTTTTTAPPSSTSSTTGQPCSACACWWSFDDEFGWLLEGTCADNGCPGCSCNPPSGPGNYQGEWRSTQCY